MGTAVKHDYLGGGFWGHPVNRAMLKSDGPLEPFTNEKYALPYIGVMKSGQVPSEEMLSSIKESTIAYCAERRTGADLQADIDGIERMWPFMHDHLKSSMGIVKLFQDGFGRSRFFYAYVYLAGNGNFAMALECKDGYFMSVAGEIEEIPEDDAMYVVGAIEPVHVARRLTDGRVQSLLRQKDIAIFEGGAGLMPAYRNYGFPLGELNQRIVACDSDARLEKYLPMVFEKPLAEYGIEYVMGDIVEVMMRPEYQGQFDIVRMTGFLSYFPNVSDKIAIMQSAKGLLKPNGIILSDIWTLGMSLARSGLTRLWPTDPNARVRFTPLANPADALAEIELLCGKADLPFVCAGDILNGNPRCYTQQYCVPKCVMFIAGKDADAEMFDAIDFDNID